jgi:hypothetical protein
VLEELVEDDLRDRLPLEVDLDPHPGAVGVILDVRDLRQHLLVDQIGDLLDDTRVAALLHSVRQLRDDDCAPAAAKLLGVRACAHHDPAAARAVRVAHAAPADHHRAGREVGPPDVFHQVLDVRVRLVDQLHDRVGDLSEPMGRHVRRHADGDTRRPVHEQVREA